MKITFKMTSTKDSITRMPQFTTPSNSSSVLFVIKATFSNYLDDKNINILTVKKPRLLVIFAACWLHPFLILQKYVFKIHANHAINIKQTLLTIKEKKRGGGCYGYTPYKNSQFTYKYPLFFFCCCCMSSQP